MIKKPEGPFDICINEYQRRLLVKILSNMSPELKNLLICVAADPSGIEDNALADAEMLMGMFDSLPEHNTEGSINGFNS